MLTRIGQLLLQNNMKSEHALHSQISSSFDALKKYVYCYTMKSFFQVFDMIYFSLRMYHIKRLLQKTSHILEQLNDSP